MLGGIGYTWEHDAHLFLRRATTAHFLNGDQGVWRDTVVEAARTGRASIAAARPAGRGGGPPGLGAGVGGRSSRRWSGRSWNTKLADDGWISPHWPEPWGRAAGPLEQLVIDDEFRAAGIRRPHLQVAGWVLPTLIAHGTDAQQERFIRRSLRAEVTWCQLFSEPGAGSDLASVTTRAERVPGGWSSPARRCGRRWRTGPTGASAWPGRTRRHPSTRASPASWWTCPHRASTFVPCGN